MYMPFLISRRNYFSEMVRGGDITADTGIVQNTMIGAGLIIVVIHPGTEQYLMIGEVVTAITGGVVIPGNLLTSPTAICIIIGAEVIGVTTMDGEVPVVAGVDITCMMVERVDVPILMGEWTEVIVAILIVVIADK
jgi:hypothetical protein